MFNYLVIIDKFVLLLLKNEILMIKYCIILIFKINNVVIINGLYCYKVYLYFINILENGIYF